MIAVPAVHQRQCRFLLVRSGTRRVGVAVEQLVEVVEPGDVFPVPSVHPAIRGVTRARGRLVPLVSLAELLSDGKSPARPSGAGVLMTIASGIVCLEVDEAEAVVGGQLLSSPAATGFPWSMGVARRGDELIPILDLTALDARSGEPDR